MSSEGTDSLHDDRRHGQRETRLKLPEASRTSGPPPDGSRPQEPKASRGVLLYLAGLVLALGAVLLLAALAVYVVLNFTASFQAQVNRPSADLNTTYRTDTTALPNATVYQPDSSTSTTSRQTPLTRPSANPAADSATQLSARPTGLSTRPSTSESSPYSRTASNPPAVISSTTRASTNPLNHPPTTPDPPTTSSPPSSEAATAVNTTSLIETAYCVDVHPAVCADVLPYNATYFPNPRSDCMEDARAKLSALELHLLSPNCAASLGRAACLLLFPECPRFQAERTAVCKRFCQANLTTCFPSVANSDWFSCDALPDGGRGVSDTCTYSEEDLLQTGICGTRVTNPLSRIVGGVAADITAWPWIGSLANEYSEHRCGATLITNRWAVTAAHCAGFFDRIVLGSSDLQGTPPTRREIITAHPSYDPVNLDHDIALVKLRTRVRFGDATRPACLNAEPNETAVFNTCYVAGWGLTAAGAVSFDLQEARVPLVSGDSCQDPSDSPYVVSRNQLCAGFSEGGVDTCQGDSGGPLVCLGVDGRWKLVGVTSSGNAACGAPESPGVYTRVSRYVDFVRQTITSDSSDGCAEGYSQK